MLLDSNDSYEMNRLVLIGNGFDLAHNLKTSYKDLIFDYFKNAIKIFLDGKMYKDCLFELSYDYHGMKVSYAKNEQFTDFKTIKNFIDSMKKSNYHNVKFHSQFFEELFYQLNEMNWVDIENKYFEILVGINNSKIKLEIKKERINNLNNEFDYIKEKLKEYLKNLNIGNINFAFNTFKNTFTQKIKKEEIVLEEIDEDIYPSALYFLNFNYTPTIYNYTNHLDSSDKKFEVSINFIHGELDNLKNPIIFGFGDELNKDYLEFENLRDNNLFTHIKSFKYSQTTNYYNLIRFIDSKDFQVYIVGHSCGLSDRTMLNQIFEHNNCKSIKIFYHKRNDDSDDFTDKTFEISRHFRDKGLMRKKLVPKELSNPMPKPRVLN